MKRFLGVSVLAALAAGTAQAQVWAEVGDAPELPVPGQITVGVGPLTTITGELAFDPAVGSLDADMYCIHIVDPVGFSATVTGGTIYDSQLFLFDLGGFGVTHNDDAGGGPIGAWSAIGAGGPGPGVGPIPIGEYGLAISGYDRDPSSAGGEIWADSPFGDETAPDGAGGSVISWAGAGDFGTYTITLTGATFCIPEPTSLALLALGGLALIRRR
jgi:hypothetical protein